MMTTKCIDKTCKGTMLMFMYSRYQSCASTWVCTKCGTEIFIKENDTLPWKLIINKLPIENRTEGKTND